MNTKASRRLKILRVLAVLIIMPVALLILLSIYSNVTNSAERHYENMKQTCETEMWAVVSDSPWHHVQEIKKPYPADTAGIRTGGPVVGLACSKQEASEQVESFQKSGDFFWYVGIYGLVLLPVFLILIIWWIIEETIYWLARTRKEDEQI